MPVTVRDPLGVAHTITRIVVRDPLGVTHDITSLIVRDPLGVAHECFSSTNAQATPVSVRGTGNSTSTISITTTAASCSIVSGTGPYTYSWASDNPAASADEPMSASTTFTASVAPGSPVSANFTCTVTDANGRVSVSNPVAAQFANRGGVF